MLINDKNQGKDSSIDPSYLARINTVEGSEQGEIEQLQREVAQLKIQLNNLQNKYDQAIEMIERDEQLIQNLQIQINNLLSTIAALEQRINELQEIIDNMDQIEPIDDDFINNLPPYNLQEGAG